MKAENVAKIRYIIPFAQEALKVGADWSNPHNERHHKLFSSPNITRWSIKKDEMGRACSTYR